MPVNSGAVVVTLRRGEYARAFTVVIGDDIYIYVIAPYDVIRHHTTLSYTAVIVTGLSLVRLTYWRLRVTYRHYDTLPYDGVATISYASAPKQVYEEPTSFTIRLPGTSPIPSHTFTGDCRWLIMLRQRIGEMVVTTELRSHTSTNVW